MVTLHDTHLEDELGHRTQALLRSRGDPEVEILLLRFGEGARDAS